MVAPGIVFFLLFKVFPMLGIVIAFQNYNYYEGILHSPFVGFAHFKELFEYPEFARIFKNTMIISFYQLIFEFPTPILLALLLNEVGHSFLKRTFQTLMYLPHFLSWVIVGGLTISLLSPSTGFVNEVLGWFGREPISFMQESSYFRSIIITSGVWKEVGWGTIVFLAALAGINPEMYESAQVDGAGKLRQLVSITLPSLLPTIMVVLLLKIGSMMDLGFEHIYMLLNPLVYDTGEVLDTFIYRLGLLGGQLSYTTAIGLFKSVIGLVLVVGANQLSKRTTGNSIY
ncbi:sugar ABC transporter permease [Cohnella fermenti]|uniref:Sugar ABC transporter permease n=2 Tax=Cohnella fermenti TaxID=2565925 RepID=A0A4S4BTS9_9BACL|nr:sugar ABC transporter permease [Cohnella fermenti]